MKNNNLKNNVVVSQNGYTLKKDNKTIKHFTKSISGNKNGCEFTCFSSTTIINFDNHDQYIDLNHTNGMNDFIETTCDEDYEELDYLPKISYRNSDK